MNLALSDEQVFLREAARGALSRFKTLEAAREALDGRPERAARPLADGQRGRLARPADRRGARRRRASTRSTRCSCSASAAACSPASRCSGTCPRPRSSTHSPNAAELARRARHRRAARGLPAVLPARRPQRRAGAATRAAASSAPSCRRRYARRRRPGARDGQLRVRPRRARRRSCFVGVALIDGKPVGVAIRATSDGVEVEPTMRYDSTRTLAPRHAQRTPPRSCSTRPRTRSLRLASRAGADRGRVARQRRDGARRVGRLRQGALHVRARDRLLPGRQALASPRCCASSRTGARCSTTPAGRAMARPASSRSRPARARSVAGACARRGRAHDDLRARRHRRDLGARRAAVLPPRAALAAAARRHRRRDRPRRRRAARPGRRRLSFAHRRAFGPAVALSAACASRAPAAPPALGGACGFAAPPAPARRRRRGPLRPARGCTPQLMQKPCWDQPIARASTWSA